MPKTSPDPIMKRVAVLFERSGMTLDALGESMGATKETARQSAWQFLNKTTDPRFSMLRRFAQAMGVSIEELVATDKKKDR